ncbi:MAG: 50S ribosomal protein L6 [candidate division WOR-3 bacterium]|nr:50S ribosomal protein L6 [Candidatus Omnitrophota bacterium]MCM8807259.1 50S ribosomal protein L6 [Candidatus Omnitrophota bacterium]
MARLGKKPVEIPEGVNVKIENGIIYVEGKNGKLSQKIFPNLSVVIEDKKIFVRNEVDPKNKKLYRKTDQLHGLLRSLIFNMVKGVTEGYEKILEIHGVGYKGEVKGNRLILTLGFTHPVEVEIPEGIKVEVSKNTVIFVRGADKQKVGEFAATIRRICPPDSYKGKGIRYRGEYVRLKPGKAAVGATK